jgi:regulator of RNase E activity RraA
MQPGDLVFGDAGGVIANPATEVASLLPAVRAHLRFGPGALRCHTPQKGRAGLKPVKQRISIPIKRRDK